MLASAQLVKPGAVTCSSHLWPFLGVWGCLGGSALHALGPSVPGGRQGPGAARGSPSCTHFLSKGCGSALGPLWQERGAPCVTVPRAADRSFFPPIRGYRGPSCCAGACPGYCGRSSNTPGQGHPEHDNHRQAQWPQGQGSPGLGVQRVAEEPGGGPAVAWKGTVCAPWGLAVCSARPP